MMKRFIPFIVAACSLMKVYGQSPDIEFSRLGGKASDQFANNPGGQTAREAFDQNVKSKWLSFQTPVWVQLNSVYASVLSKYTITSANDFPGRNPKNWQLLASNDGLQWTVLDTRSNIVFTDTFQLKEFVISNPGTVSYSQFRLNVTSNADGSTGITQIGEIGLYSSSSVGPQVSAPLADFRADKASVSASSSVTFYNLSKGNNNSYSWSFPGGIPSSSTAKNPTVTYTQPGKYAVTLTVTNPVGQTTETRNNLISVKTIADNNWTSITVPTVQKVVENSGNNGVEGAQIFANAFPSLQDSVRAIALKLTKDMYNNVEEAPAVSNITILLKYDTTFIAYASRDGSNATVTVSTDWILDMYHGYGNSMSRAALELKGMLFHEITHLYQPGPVGSTPYGVRGDIGAFIEGQADFIRIINVQEGRVPYPGASYLDGYSETAFYFKYIADTYFAGNYDNFSYALYQTVVGLNPYWSFERAVPALTGGKSNDIVFRDYQYSLTNPGNNKPVVEFYANPGVIAKGQSVSFVNQSYNNPGSYNWTFTGASPSTSTNANPSGITYTNAGTYAVSLKAKRGTDSTTVTKSGFLKVADVAGEMTDITNFIGYLTTDGSPNTVPAENLDKLVDNNEYTKYFINRSSAWIQWEALGQFALYGYSLTSGNDYVSRDPLNWTLKGSNNGTSWTNLHTVSSHVFTGRNQKDVFLVTNTAGTKYRFFRLEFNNSNVDVNMQLSEWELFALINNQLPSVNITSPANGATYSSAPATVAINVTATDTDGVISKVEFFNGTTKLGETSALPYSYSWTNVAAGNYSLTAKATDDIRGVSTSTAVTITVGSGGNIPPAVSISSPANGATYAAPASVTITATATDADGTVSKVEFFNGSAKLGEVLSAPFSYNWTNVAAGTYNLTAKATDNASGSTTSSVVTITINSGTDNCSSLPAYAENGGYVAGSIVKNGGNRYECKPYPYTGWCNGAAWAYAPGTGSVWQDAWTLLGPCQSARMSAVSSASVISCQPNPFTTSASLMLSIPSDGYTVVALYDAMGQKQLTVAEGYMKEGVQELSLNVSGLKNGMYFCRVSNEEQVYTITVLKGE